MPRGILEQESADEGQKEVTLVRIPISQALGCHRGSISPHGARLAVPTTCAYFAEHYVPEAALPWPGVDSFLSNKIIISKAIHLRSYYVHSTKVSVPPSVHRTPQGEFRAANYNGCDT